MAQSGSFWLRDLQIADLVAESLHHRDGRVHDLDAFCIMPNHVHVVYTYHAMSSIMHSLKRYTPARPICYWDVKGAFGNTRIMTT